LPATTEWVDAPIPGDELLLHPALVGAALRGRAGSKEAAATLVRLLSLGAVNGREITFVEKSFLGRSVTRRTLELKLAQGWVSSRHPRGGGTIVKRGHVGGLSKIDRGMLSVIFDRIAHSDHITLRQIDVYSSIHPHGYSSAIREWRELVVSIANEKGLLEGKTKTHAAREARQLRRQVRRRIASLSAARSGAASERLLELSVVFGLERHLSRALAPPTAAVMATPTTGLQAASWLCYGDASAPALIGSFAHTFTPYYPSGYAPTQQGGFSSFTGSGGSGGAAASPGGGGGGFSGGGGDGGGGGGGGGG